MSTCDTSIFSYSSTQGCKSTIHVSVFHAHQRRGKLVVSNGKLGKGNGVVMIILWLRHYGSGCHFPFDQLQAAKTKSSLALPVGRTP